MLTSRGLFAVTDLQVLCLLEASCANSLHNGQSSYEALGLAVTLSVRRADRIYTTAC